MNAVWIGLVSILVVVVVLQVAASIVLFRLVGVLLLRIGPNYAKAVDRLPWGERVPVESCKTLEGTSISLSGEVPALLVYLSTTCGLCTRIPPALSGLSPFFSDRFRMVALIEGDREAVTAWIKAHPMPGVGVAATADQPTVLYEGLTSPYGILVDADGKVITHGVINDREMIENLLLAHESRSARDAVPVRADALPMSSGTGVGDDPEDVPDDASMAHS